MTASVASGADLLARFLRLDHLIDNPATALSGGNRQKVALAEGLLDRNRVSYFTLTAGVPAFGGTTRWFALNDKPSDGVKSMLDALNATTGWDVSLDELVDAGHRAIILQSLFGTQRGWIAEQDLRLTTREAEVLALLASGLSNSAPSSSGSSRRQRSERSRPSLPSMAYMRATNRRFSRIVRSSHFSADG